jgi:Fur family transcriptional regulator, ferric uptake regulator
MTGASLAEALRARGMRLTNQRQLVLDAVRSLRHGTPEQIHARVAERATGVNITTVYRTLDLLEEIGLVTHTHLDHGPPAYHSTDEDSHVHVVCRRCGRVFAAEPSLLQPIADRLRADRGFEVDIDHVALFGTCADCAGNEAGNSARSA